MSKKHLVILFLISILIVLTPVSGFAVTKLSNGNYEYTANEVNNIRKTLETLQNEIASLKESNKIEKERYEAIIKIKDQSANEKVQFMKDSMDKLDSLYSKLITVYEDRISNMNQMLTNETEQYKLADQKVSDWKSVADKLNSEAKTNKATLKLLTTTSVILGLGVIGLSVSR